MHYSDVVGKHSYERVIHCLMSLHVRLAVFAKILEFVDRLRIGVIQIEMETRLETNRMIECFRQVFRASQQMHATILSISISAV